MIFYGLSHSRSMEIAAGTCPIASVDSFPLRHGIGDMKKNCIND